MCGAASGRLPPSQALHLEVFAQVHTAYGCVINDLVGHAACEHFTFANDIGAVADTEGFAYVVICNEHADAAAFQKAHDALDFNDGNRVYTSEGFVQQNKSRARRERTRNFYAPAFSAGTTAMTISGYLAFQS